MKNKYNILILMVFVLLIVIVVILLFINDEKIMKRLKHRITTLEIYIDEERKTKDIEKITRSDYFAELSEKAEKIKKNET